MTAPFYTRRVADRKGSHVEPPLGQSWSNLEKLEWKISSVLRDARLPSDTLRVETGFLTVDGVPVESYNIYGLGWSASVGDFYDAWSTINGIGYGLRVVT